MKPYRVCVRCVMDTSDPYIVFNSRGECNHCTDFIHRRLKVTSYQNKSKNSEALTALFNGLLKGRTHRQQYDVIVGVSGGVDSSYTVLRAQEAGLKVLAVHMDNGWDTPTSIRNICKLITLPRVGYRSVVLNWNRFKFIQRAFIEAGVPDIELPTDIAIQTVLYRIAHRYGVKTILAGGNISNEGILPAAWLYNGRDSFYARSVMKAVSCNVDLFDEIDFGLSREVYYRFITRIRTFYPLNYLDYDKKEAKATLSNKIAWEDYGGKHCESTFTRFTQLIYLPMRHSADYRKGYFSADICLERMTREQALHELRALPWSSLDVHADIAFVSSKLGYATEDLWRIIGDPPKWYRDFPNNERLLGALYTTYRLLTGRGKASNF